MPVTATPPGWVASCTVEAVTVVAFKGSDSWATGAAVTLIPVAPSGGVTVTTVGAVVSVTLPQVSLASAQSAWS